MEAIEKYTQRPSSELVEFQEPLDGSSDSTTSLIKPILKRWWIVLLTAIVICAIGIPAIWYTIKPYYQATGAIRITPVIPNILVGGDEVMPMYNSFKATQAELITSNEVLQRAADNLIDQDPDFFKSTSELDSLKENFVDLRKPTPISVLRNALNSGRFLIEPESNTELIKISMNSTDPKKAERIVNAFMRAYMSIVVSRETEDENQELSILEDERKLLLAEFNQKKQEIRALAEEYGTDSLSTRQEITLQRVGALRSKLTEFETQKITLQVKEQLLQQKQGVTIEPEDMIKLRHDFVNVDLMVQSLTSNISQLEQDLIATEQRLAPANPEIARKTKLLEAMRERLETRRVEVGETFNEIVSREFSQNNKEKLESIQTELEQIAIYETHLRELIAKEDSETIKLGHKQLAMEDLQDQLELTEEMYDTVQRRIQELQMERKRPARISEAYYAQNVLYQDERTKYAAAVAFGALATGLGLALLLDKLDYSVHTPEDIPRHIKARVIGTTTNISSLKRSLAPAQIANDYHTICTNLRLFGDGEIPQRLVIGSARSREGKSTLAANLATSIAQTGKKVLLIDGDLRKPDLARMLNIPAGSNKLNELVWEDDISRAIYPTQWSGLHVLTASPHESSDIYTLLSQNRTAEVIDKLAMQYDHIIIDTPPIMVFSDALSWAKISGTVLLTSFSGFTTGSDLTHCMERLTQIGVRIAGVVLNNVRIYDSFNYYGYEKYGNVPSPRKRTRNTDKLLLTKNQKGLS